LDCDKFEHSEGKEKEDQLLSINNMPKQEWQDACLVRDKHV
jgi:hypothetical protein